MRKIGFGSGFRKIGFDTYGTLAKISADFVTGEYRASGVIKTFNEVFTFNRAGKAWLVKESGLVEYAVDMPRLDNGLLIEQSATNLIFHSSLPNVGTFNRYNAVFGANYWQKQTTGQAARLNPATAISAKQNHVISIGSIDGDFSAAYLSSQSVPLTKIGAVSYGFLDTALDSRLSGIQWLDVENTQKPKYVQVEVGTKPTSFIKTENTTSVTRPADFLSSKITTGSTLTGDWDSTLTLSISNGQIVHSGYGRIRSLEIT